MAACKGHGLPPVPLTLQNHFSYSAVHHQAQTMADFAKAYALSLSPEGILNGTTLKLPFCHTTWAEHYGAIVQLGDWQNGPRVIKPNPHLTQFPSVADLQNLSQSGYSHRLQVVLDAIALLHSEGLQTTLLLDGPFTLLTEMVGLTQVMRSSKKEQEAVLANLAELASELIQYTKLALAAGASCISFADPLASKTLLGSAYYDTFIHPCHGQMASALKAMSDQTTQIVVCPLLVADNSSFTHFKPCCTSLDSLTFA